jgi:hypothetical protein
LTSKFTLSSSKGTGLIFVLDESLDVVDIEAMLKFDDEEIDDLLHTHASIQAYWEAFALRLKTKLDNFKEDWKSRWWAWNKKYAKDVLISYGETKYTIDSITDMVINIFGKSVTDNQREQFANAGYLIANKRASCSESKEEYKSSMFKYILSDPAWYYEDVVNTESKLSENYEIVRIVAERLNAKSFHIKEVIGLVQQKPGNTGLSAPRDERGLMRFSKGS